MKHILFSSLIMFSFILSQAQPVNGLVAYWRLDGNFTDAGPNNINGTNFGATATTNYASIANSAINFSNPGAYNVVPQYATHPINANLSFGTAQDFSIVFSVYANSPIVHPGGFYDNNLNYGGCGIWFWNANGFPQIQFNFKNSSIGTTNGAFLLGVWRHVCAVRTAGTLKIYINGVLNVSGAEGTLTPAYNYPARFGTMFANSLTPPQYNGHNGKLDELRIYNRALTSAEIVALASTILPVKLTSFIAANNNNNITLQWRTAYEQNSSYYNLQRSTDGINFTNIDRVSAAGNSNVPLAYSHTDLLPAMFQNIPTVFYRLQAVDIDGLFAYSQVVAVHLNKKDMQLLVFPNPAKDVLQVQTANGPAGNATLVITDAMGRQLYKKEIALQQGSNSMPVNISLFAAGVYNVRLINGSESFTKQFIKE